MHPLDVQYFNDRAFESLWFLVCKLLDFTQLLNVKGLHHFGISSNIELG